MMKPGVSFVAFLATFYAFNSIVVTNGKSAATFYNGKGIIVEGNKNTFNLGHDAEIKTALSQIQKRSASLEEKISAVHPLQQDSVFTFLLMIAETKFQRFPFKIRFSTHGS